MLIDSRPYDDLLNQYRSSTRWLEGLGLNIGNKRVERYSKFLEYLTGNYKTLEVEEYRKIYPEAVNTLYEVTAISEIYESLNKIPIEDLGGVIGKLKKAITGPDHSIDETASSQEARNYLFEVITIARLHKPENKLFAMLNAKTDTGIDFLNKKIYIECKRIHSVNNLEKNIRDASNQLKKVISGKIGSGKRGLIALDVSKLINPEFNLLVQPTERSLLNSLSMLVGDFISDNNHIWNKVIREKSNKIYGVIIRVSVMGVSEDRNLLVTCSQWGLNPRNDAKEIDNLLLRELAKSLDG